MRYLQVVTQTELESLPILPTKVDSQADRGFAFRSLEKSRIKILSEPRLLSMITNENAEKDDISNLLIISSFRLIFFEK